MCFSGVGKFDGERMGAAWIFQDKNLAFTTSFHRKTKDCQGRAITFSDQGLAFRVISEKLAEPTISEQLRQLKVNHTRRLRGDARGDLPEGETFPPDVDTASYGYKTDSQGIVTTGLLAANLQTIQLDLETSLRQSFQHSFYSNCRTMHTLVSIVRANMLAQIPYMLDNYWVCPT